MPAPTPHERLAARARRVALMRRRVIAAACASFALAWAVIAHSGSMGTQAAASPSPSTSTSTSGSASASDDQGTVTSSDDSGALTTAQS